LIASWILDLKKMVKQILSFGLFLFYYYEPKDKERICSFSFLNQESSLDSLSSFLFHQTHHSLSFFLIILVGLEKKKEERLRVKRPFLSLKKGKMEAS
jgi:hypothetical protein